MSYSSSEAPIRLAMTSHLLPPYQCRRLMQNQMLVVAPDHGLIWCPNAKVGTTTMYEILRRKLLPHLHSMPRCFPSACPDRVAYTGTYPLMLPRSVPMRHELCNRRKFVSFTFVRNPWDRLASAFFSKIDRGTKVRDRQAQNLQSQIRSYFGMHSTQKIHFEKFVRWVVQQNASEMNPHWKPHSERCDTRNMPYEFVGRYETMQEDLLHIITMLGWSPSLIPATHWSSLVAAGLSRTNESQRLLKLYNSRELVQMVAQKYRDDIRIGGYQFPGMVPQRIRNILTP